MLKKPCSVTYATKTVDPRDSAPTYWFEAKVSGFEWTSICFGLSNIGECTSASCSFYELKSEVREELLKVGRELLSKVLN